MTNVYFDLTRRFNQQGTIAILASGQAVVYYRVAIMSKDGDWILKESEVACRRVLEVLGERGAVYRPGAPLDPAWLAGGWSSHFELFDERQRRVRCDFFSRPPRIAPEEVDAAFAAAASRNEPMPVVGLEPLIQMKRTMRAKDYAVIGELARLLPADRELELTTDLDRILELVSQGAGGTSSRAVVRAAREAGRDAALVALAREMDTMRRQDRERLAVYEEAAGLYLRELRRLQPWDRPLPLAHRQLQDLAEGLLPKAPRALEGSTEEG